MSIKTMIVAVSTVAVLSSPGLVVITTPAAASAPDSVAAGKHDDRRQGRDNRDNRDNRDGKGHKKQQKRRPFQVEPGVVFSNPHRPDQAGLVIDKIKRTIGHVPPGERIRIMTWNFQGVGLARKLIAAHRRGVSVRLIMARALAKRQGPQGSFHVLTRALRKGNKGRPGYLTSFTRTCANTCRGGGGAMHAKFMLVSKSGATRYVLQQGSANLTTSAATNQWNDWYTMANNRPVYEHWQTVFSQALQEGGQPASEFTWRHVYSWFSPRPRRPDPVLRLLNDVKCKGAEGAGIDGRTAIRVASAVFQDARGLEIARTLQSLHRAGCNVRVVFTMMPSKIRQALAGVPTRQLVYDWNYDGIFDRYLHMKSMTISGRFRDDRSHHLVFNGSANWSWTGMISDEQGMVIHGRSIERQYARHINWMFGMAPRLLRPSVTWYRARGVTNPYAGLELELDGR